MNHPENQAPRVGAPSPAAAGWMPWVAIFATLAILNYCWFSFL